MIVPGDRKKISHCGNNLGFTATDGVEVRNLMPDDQDNIARAVLRLVGTDAELPVDLSLDERAAIAASKSAAARGEFASDERVRAAWAKHGL
jgi:hypothetical protein